MNKIKEERLNAGISRKEFSKLFGIPIRTIENWENDVTSPPAYVENLIIEKLKELAKN